MSVVCEVGIQDGGRWSSAESETMTPKDQKEYSLITGRNDVYIHKPVLRCDCSNTKYQNGIRPRN